MTPHPLIWFLNDAEGALGKSGLDYSAWAVLLSSGGGQWRDPHNARSARSAAMYERCLQAWRSLSPETQGTLLAAYGPCRQAVRYAVEDWRAENERRIQRAVDEWTRAYGNDE